MLHAHHAVRALPAFALEEFLAKHRSSARFTACAPDVDPVTVKDLLAMADDESRELWENAPLLCTDRRGLLALRQEIVRQFYANLTTDQVTVLCPQEGVFLAMNALLSPGDHVVAVSPAYQSLTSVAESIECEVSLWKCREDDSDPNLPLVFRVSDLEHLLRPTTKLVVVNFPHNPTGFLPSPAEWEALIALCRARGVFLFSDEMFRGLERDPPLQLAPAATLYDKAVSLSGMSKVFGMPGIRLGWLASQDQEFLASVAKMKDYTSLAAPNPSQVLALIGLRNMATLLERGRTVIDKGIQAVQAFMDVHRDVFAFTPPLAGPIAFVKVRSATSKTVAEYAAKLVKASGVLILPGQVFGDETFNDRFRLSVGRSNVREVMAAWEADFVAP